MRQIIIRLQNEDELRELRNAALVRQEQLKKAIDKSMKEYLPAGATEARERLALWQGKDGEPGIVEVIADQMSVFEIKFEEPQTREQHDAFEAAAAEAAEGEGETAPAERSEWVEADYEIVEGPARLGSGSPLQLASGD